ncbi:hypothetical protein FE257_011686 [Aspergillus nanangensis]|uniref:Nucleoporin NUP49/NSP49 n=1 Tax=Aspergillus nanangensis TaxID=2582783 RepID=A0AAD4CVD8_ASPNN|nr:hypothetical protein FE257_011686 [Aspergillus nanangensis]
MFGAKPSAPSGLSINTGAANSPFGGNNAQPNPTAGTGTTGTTSSLFGNAAGGNTQQTAPSGPNMFAGLGGGQQTTSSGSNMFAGLGGGQQQAGNTGGGLLGGANNAATAPQSGGAGSLFGGNTTTQAQSNPLFSGLGGSAAAPGASLFGANAQQPQQQQQQQAPKPTLSLFGNQSATTQQPAQQTPATGTVVPGVKVDVSNLLPTTKYESCADEIRNHLEQFDNHVLAQIKICNEVASMIPSIASQGETIPNDVDFVQGKLETMQHALENDANNIDQLRNLVARDAAEAEVAFRAIDTLKLPLQYQSAGGWTDQKMDRQSVRTARKNTLALPDDVEGDSSNATTVNGVPVNLVDYFSQRSDEMGSVLDTYSRNLKEIEDHLHGVEATLERQILEFVSRSRDGSAAGAPKTMLNDLVAALGDVESGIIGVANRLGGVTEQAQEVAFGPLSGGDGRLNL